ncbi:MAG: hypothetical protein H5U40_09905, partial [Polyangiaceae bacterium]|nr:hypothetical protein [Polyangiaceae bacterium]
MPTSLDSLRSQRFTTFITLFAYLAVTGCSAGASGPGDPDAGAPPYPDGGAPPDSGYPGDGYSNCDETDPYYQGGPIAEPDDDALIWSRRGGWFAWDFCACRPDDTVIPADPRTFVHPEASEGRAVAFNVDWKDCHQYPELVGEPGYPATCGELRARVAHGADLLIPGRQGGGALFSGTEYQNLSAGLGIAIFPASAYNDMWKSWGLAERPENFDFLVSQRVGA